MHEGTHVRLTMLLDPLPRAVRVWTERATELATAALGAFLVWSGWRFFDITAGSVSAAIGYPIELVNALAPVSGALMLLFALERALRPGGIVPPPEIPVS